MAVTPFTPKFMKVGVLTAALQELTPRAKRDPDPDLAIEEWLAFAQELALRLDPDQPFRAPVFRPAPVSG